MNSLNLSLKVERGCYSLKESKGKLGALFWTSTREGKKLPGQLSQDETLPRCLQLALYLPQGLTYLSQIRHGDFVINPKLLLPLLLKVCLSHLPHFSRTEIISTLNLHAPQILNLSRCPMRTQ